jgi:putative methyltransferase (TIGR04325 family)
LFSLKKKNISVLDIGGAFGTAYFNNLEYLRLFEKINWVIVEQKPLVGLAKTVDVFQSVQFFDSMETGFDMESVDLVLLSGSLQYIEFYKEILEKINNSKAAYCIIDRIPLLEGIKGPRIFKQVVSQSIYDASYPIWMLLQKDLNQILGNYTLFNFSPSLVDGKMYTNKGGVKFFQLVYKSNKNYWGNDV